MWKTLFAFTLVACFALACESSSGAEGGTSAPTTPKTPDQGGVVPNGGDQGNDTAPETVPADVSPEIAPPFDPLMESWAMQLVGKVFQYEECKSVFESECYTQPTELITPEKTGFNVACPDAMHYALTGQGGWDVGSISALCMDTATGTEVQLSLCKYDPEPCVGVQIKDARLYKKMEAQGMCALAGGITAQFACTTDGECRQKVAPSSYCAGAGKLRIELHVEGALGTAHYHEFQ